MEHYGKINYRLILKKNIVSLDYFTKIMYIYGIISRFLCNFMKFWYFTVWGISVV